MVHQHDVLLKEMMLYLWSSGWVSYGCQDREIDPRRLTMMNHHEMLRFTTATTE